MPLFVIFTIFIALYSIQCQICSVVSFSDSAPPPEQATTRRSQSNATDRDGSDERYDMYSYTLCCVVPMSAVIDCPGHTSPGCDEK